MGRALYGQRFATVEPVFGNLPHHKGLNRFTLRGKKKVDAHHDQHGNLLRIEISSAIHGRADILVA